MVISWPSFTKPTETPIELLPNEFNANHVVNIQNTENDVNARKQNIPFKISVLIKPTRPIALRVVILYQILYGSVKKCGTYGRKLIQARQVKHYCHSANFHKRQDGSVIVFYRGPLLNIMKIRQIQLRPKHIADLKQRLAVVLRLTLKYLLLNKRFNG